MDIEFDDEFASILDYVKMYRQLGLQVVPSVYPNKSIANWKRPALPEWRDYQNEIVSDATFEKWFKDVDSRRLNIGILTGNCSNRVFVVDLDTHSKPDAAIWWACCLDMQETAADLDTPTQRTGGGGLQLLFRAPEGWNPPTIKTSMGVDIRGIGGFAVIAPSMHASGKNYAWEENKEPWNIEIATAPQWFCDQIDTLAQEHGGHTPSSGTTKTSSPDYTRDFGGALIDGREDYMAKMIWARLADIARDCPIKPPEREMLQERDNLFQVYFSKVDTRLPHGADYDKAQLLDREGRGKREFDAKWRASSKDWDKVIDAAKVPKPERPERLSPIQIMQAEITAGLKDDAPTWSRNPEETSIKSEKASKDEEDFSVDDDLFEVLDMEGIFNLPDPTFLIEDLLIEDALSFIYGVPGCLKTFISLDLALSLACKEIDNWWGRKINKHGPVVYISCEGVSDMKFRIAAWESKTGKNRNDIPFFLIKENLNFMEGKDIVKLIRSIRRRTERACGQPPIAIFIDTVSRVLPGADENLQKDMTKYVFACDTVRKTFGCAVIGIHHMNASPNNTRMRGSTVFDGSSDCSLHVEREEGAMGGVITARKIKAAQDGWSMEFEATKVVIGIGKTSLYVSKLDTHQETQTTHQRASEGFGGRQETGKEPDMDLCRKMVTAIGDAYKGGYAWSKEPNTKRQGRYAAEKLADQFGVTIEIAEKMISLWIKTDVIVDECINTKNKTYGLRVGKGL